MTCAILLETEKNMQEEEERRIEAQHPYYLEDNQSEWERRRAYFSLNERLNQIVFNNPHQIDHSIPTGDSALDDSDEDDDYLIPGYYIAEEEEVGTTQEYTDIDSDGDSRLDTTEEIDLNKLF